MKLLADRELFTNNELHLAHHKTAWFQKSEPAYSHTYNGVHRALQERPLKNQTGKATSSYIFSLISLACHASVRSLGHFCSNAQQRGQSYAYTSTTHNSNFSSPLHFQDSFTAIQSCKYTEIESWPYCMK